MERFGFIHDKLDIKILILFILGRLEAGVDMDTLTSLSLCDEGISYFDFSECVAELAATDHIQEQDGLISITEKGIKNGQITESSIPYSVRKKAEKQTTALARIQRRNSMLVTKKHLRESGGFTVKLAMNDGLGEILSIEMFAANESQADSILNGFSKKAEELYGLIIATLTDDAPGSK